LFQISNCDTIQPLKPNGATVKSKVFISIIILSGSLACGGSSYPEGYSEADKACFDYGAEACENFQRFCNWQDGDPDQLGGDNYWWYLEENADFNQGYFFRDQRYTCEILDSNNEAYYSGAVDAGCDLMTFTGALESLDWTSVYSYEEEVWKGNHCVY
jgi:hypothetical protein